ncbi:hypothetical protein BX616_004791 [Lobosporangium transversale]|nr:hypothetical protein BX616_004791 [Lobosporangium transversale]
MIRKTRLRRLCETIETLVFDKHYFEVSGIVQAILSNCPHLKQLTGPKIMVTEIVSGVEWVSTRLTNLTIYLEANVDQETAEGMAKQRIAFRQLGKLTRLRTLDLTSWRRENDKRTLDLRLRAGLNELANLKNLDSLVFRGDNHQRMGLEEATWIVDNWPSIRCLNGHPTNEEDVYTLSLTIRPKD